MKQIKLLLILIPLSACVSRRTLQLENHAYWIRGWNQGNDAGRTVAWSNLTNSLGECKTELEKLRRLVLLPNRGKFTRVACEAARETDKKFCDRGYEFFCKNMTVCE